MQGGADKERGAAAKQAYATRTEQAVDVLGRMQEEKPGDGIYKLQTKEAVFQRARDILERAESIVVIDAFPNALNELKADVNQAAARGINVYVQAYANITLQQKFSSWFPG